MTLDLLKRFLLWARPYRRSYAVGLAWLLILWLVPGLALPHWIIGLKLAGRAVMERSRESGA